MRTISLVVLIIALGMPICAGEKLYLIVGTPTPAFETEDFALKLAEVADGNAAIVRDIVPGTRGAMWVSLNRNRDVALFLVKNPWELLVFDLRRFTTAKACPLPGESDHSPLRKSLVDTMGSPLMFFWIAALPTSGFVNRTMNLDPSIPCALSFSESQTGDVSGMMANGAAGPAGPAGNEGMPIVVSRDGRPATPFGKLPYQVPEPTLSEVRQFPASLMVNTPQSLVLGVGEAKSRFLLMLRKRDGKWMQLPIPAKEIPRIRAFGQYITGLECRPVTRASSGEVGAGHEKWRHNSTATGPDIHEFFESAVRIPTGRLHLYNIETEQAYSIETNQSDSEILLVEEGTLYYRVLNRIYSARIMERKLGPATLLAESELIEDAHWAFLKK